MTNRNSYKKYLNGINRNHNRFLFSPVNEKQMEFVIRKLKNTGVGLDGKSSTNFYFRRKGSKHAEIITYVYSKSLTTGVYPKGLTVARITCIFKAGSRKSASDCRPTALFA